MLSKHVLNHHNQFWLSTFSHNSDKCHLFLYCPGCHQVLPSPSIPLPLQNVFSTVAIIVTGVVKTGPNGTGTEIQFTV